jgi:hypothetical protein
MLVDRSSCADEIQNGVEALSESADSGHRHHVACEHAPLSCRDTCVEGPGCMAWRHTTECASPLPANVISPRHRIHCGCPPRPPSRSRPDPAPGKLGCRSARRPPARDHVPGSPRTCGSKSLTRAARQVGRQHQACGKSCRASPRTRERRAGEAARTCSGCVLLWSQPSLRRRCLLVGALFICVYTQPSSAASNLNSF